MVSKIIIIIIIIFQNFIFSSTKAETWIRAAYYWHEQKEFPISNINSSLFTHLICGFANIDPTSYELSFSQSDRKHFSTFTETVKKKNPSVTTLLSVGKNAYDSTLSSMVSNSSSRTSFIDSSIEEARHYGFQGLDFWWDFPTTSEDMDNIDLLFKQWRQAITVEATNSTKTKLILTAMVNYFPKVGPQNYPVDSIQKYLDWVHVRHGAYFLPNYWTNFTATPTALYNPNSTVNSTDYGIRLWIDAGLSPKKMVLTLPYYGYAWTLKNPNENGIGAPANGQAQASGLTYKEIKNYIDLHKAKVTFDATYVVNYLTMGTSWIAFDDVEAIQSKVSYAKEKGLLGYYVWQVSYDDNNWELSKTAAQGGHAIIFPPPEDNRNGQKKQPYRLLVIVLPIIAAVILLLGFVIYIYYRWMRKNKSKVQESRNQVNIATAAAAGDFSGNAPTLALYSLAYIEEATNRFSRENKLGEGGYGPVYKGVLQDGQEVAVKKLSKTSTQGFEDGKRVSILYGENDHLSLLEYAYELWKDGKGMEFMDPSLDDTYSPCRLIRCLHIALLCVQEMPIDRPSMLEVSWMLRNEATNLLIPKKPDLSKQTDHEVVPKESSTSNSEIRSDIDTTVSDLEAR
ncbi:hypothetical protein LWI29_021523 [Acer saccharum]|uniref:GH18 domain-containing protein n=1 Tax=Acer saccharum TaxID=4024 RepID=A0AA39V8K3_ACESA|nr:hypothetical protein LWI29_021523 [Acer saccharum]